LARSLSGLPPWKPGERGEPYNISLKLSFDIAAGVGVGASLGITGKYLDEVEFPRKVTDIYLGRQNYLITSAEYTDQMKNVSFTNMLETLFSGTIPLIQTALLNLQSILKKGLQAAEEFVTEVFSKTTQKAGEIIGKAPGFAGDLFVSVYEMITPRTSQKSFSTPEIRMMYYSTDVIHKSINENNELSLDEVETLLIMVSEAMTIGFIPDGDTVSIDSLDTPFELKMIIYDQRLFDNDFTTDDKDKVKIYYYHIDSLCWILEGGTRNADTVSTSILKMGTYALGIELDVTEDITSPTIYEKGRDPDQVDNSTPEIYARVRDDRFGSGIDLTKTHLILNGDTLDSYYDPSNEKVFYQFPDSSRLSDGNYKVNIIATDFAGNISKDSLSFTLEGTGTNIDSKIPGKFMLSQNYPNPFIESTTINYSLAKEGDVEINIYNNKGQYVKRLIQNRLPTGEYNIVWDGTNNWGYRVSSGIYFYQLKFEDHNVVKKMQLIRSE